MADIGNKIAAHLFQIVLQRHIHQQHGDDAIINPPQTHAKLAPAVIGRAGNIFDGTVAAEDSVEIIAEIGSVDQFGDHPVDKTFPKQTHRCRIDLRNPAFGIEDQQRIIKNLADACGINTDMMSFRRGQGSNVLIKGFFLQSIMLKMAIP